MRNRLTKILGSLMLASTLAGCEVQPADSAVTPAPHRGDSKADNPNGVTPFFYMHEMSAYMGASLMAPAVDDKDRVYVTGDCLPSLAPGKITCTYPSKMLVRYSPTGAVDWARLLTPPSSWGAQAKYVSVGAPRIDKLGRAVIAGQMDSILYVDGDKVLETTGQSGYQLVLDEDGTIVEAVLTPRPVEEYGQVTSATPAWSKDGELFIARTERAYSTGWGNPLYGSVEKLPSATTEGWRRQMNHSGEHYGCLTATALEGGEVVASCYGDSRGLYEGDGTGVGASHLVAYDVEGRFLSARRFDGTVAGLAALRDGSLVVTGSFRKALQLGGNQASVQSENLGHFVTVIAGH